MQASQESHINSLFYIVRLRRLIILQTEAIEFPLELELSMGGKKSRTVIEKEIKFSTTAHLFKFEGDQFLELTLEPKEKKKEHQKKEQRKEHKPEQNKSDIPLQSVGMSQTYFNHPKKRRDSNNSTAPAGNYLSSISKKRDQQIMEQKPKKIKRELIVSRVFLSPLAEKPLKSIHAIRAWFIYPLRQLDRTEVATLELQIVIYPEFEAQLEIIPISANLSRNVAIINEMNPYVKLKVGKEQWVSSTQPAGSIHPCWFSSEILSLKQKFAQDSLEAMKLLAESTQKYIDQASKNELLCKELVRLLEYAKISTQKSEPISAKCPIMERKTNNFKLGMIFDLHDAGADLEVVVSSLSTIIGVKEDVETVRLNLQNESFFKHFSRQENLTYRKKEIIFKDLPEGGGKASSLSVFYRFIFDIKKYPGHDQ